MTHQIAQPFASNVERQNIPKDPAAMYVLGMRLMSGSDDDFDPNMGAELLLRAAQGGHAEACARMSSLAAAGVCRTQSWQESLDWLQQAADLGWRSSQEQLLLLSADGEIVEQIRSAISAQAALPANGWGALRQSIDLRLWLTPPQKEVLSEAPRVRAFRDFIPPELCRWLIDSARDKLRRAATYSALDRHE